MTSQQDMEHGQWISEYREQEESEVSPASPCSHDYHKPVRKGRARYHCRKCDADISLDVILIAEAEMESENSQDQEP